MQTKTAQHTPGPWTTEDHKHPSDQVFSGGVIVADCKWTNYTPDVREANARLVAAAPELLENLSGLLAWIEHARHQGGEALKYLPDVPYLDSAYRAIKKAEGRA